MKDAVFVITVQPVQLLVLIDGCYNTISCQQNPTCLHNCWKNKIRGSKFVYLLWIYVVYSKFNEND